MSTIRVKNVGPIRDTGLIELRRVMVLIGQQSSGKSTLMKILCFCRWLEKSIMIDEAKVKWYTSYKRFVKELKSFHRLDDSFFSSDSEICYRGTSMSIEWQGRGNQNARITLSANYAERRHNSKLCFIPSERNLVAAIQNIDKAYKSSELDLIFNFIFEWDEARRKFGTSTQLPLSVAQGVGYFYQRGKDYIYLKERQRKLSTLYASSGIQSALPIEAMVDYYSAQVGELPKLSLSEVREFLYKSTGDTPSQASLLQYASVQFFIEEPELNLFPSSQRDLVLKLLCRFHQITEVERSSSMLVMTTHSPYILSMLNMVLAVARAIEQKPHLTSQIEEHLGLGTCPLKTQDYAAYFINTDGTLSDLVDRELPMISGVELDGVSDWVDDGISYINELLYGE
ncbi:MULTISPECIES: AAA family ATPase [Porphyromonas]|uniref:AAA family ATPase n=1 Tax=Porphyromonas TaxID=836 RepID=UPI00051DC7E2|nr:hypothetical protein HQ49_05910 [Porphyromonas gulae]KGL55019.1 hypothetical protein HQ50_08040 [Porphyromonas sp. COT-052 OH4946]